MPVAFDAATESTEWTGTTPATPTHTPVGVARACAIFVLSADGATTDVYTGATYGTRALERVTGLYAADTATEPGTSTVYFAGSDIPTGAQTFTVIQSGGSGPRRRVYCVTWTADVDTYIVGTGIVQEDAANPSATIDTGSIVASIAAGLYSGRPTASIAPTAGMTTRFETAVATDARTFNIATETTPTSGSRARGWTAASDDVAGVWIAVAERPIRLPVHRVVYPPLIAQ
jgi:hypothetical protein